MDHEIRLVEDAQALFRAAVQRVQADRLLEHTDIESMTDHPLAAYRRVVVAGMGKASMAMASVLEAYLGARIDEGAVVVPEGYPASLPERFSAPDRIEVLEGGHPVPDIGSLQAGERMLALAEGCTEEDLFLVLISGGGTALCTAFAKGVALNEAQQTYKLLLEGGVDIHAMNAVRKHLSRIGGGQLARAAHPAEVIALVVSDVVGDDLPVIASGPTVPDPSTFADAAAVLQEHGLWEHTPLPVRVHLEAGQKGERPETPKPDDSLFDRARTELIGRNRDALGAARRAAEERGYEARIVAEGIEGEAREVGREQVKEALEATGGTPRCLLWGSETTVTVRGSGKGGRNQELALAAALALEDSDASVVLLSGGTDGIDGPTDAAGAWATPSTAVRAREKGLDPEQYLKDNDAYSFFDALGALLRPGPTHTNVMDVQIALVAGTP